jgi:hypothetical protein
MLEREVNFLGRQRDLGKQVFVRVRHAVSQVKLLQQCSAGSEKLAQLMMSSSLRT